MRNKFFTALSFVAVVFAFCANAPFSFAKEEQSSLRALSLEEVPEFFHPLGQTRVDVLEQSGILANQKYGAIKFVGDTTFKAKDSFNQTVTLNTHPVFASQSGYFYMHGINDDGTSRVMIKHLDGSKTYYSHIDRNSVVFNDGAPVKKGEILGNVKGDKFGFSIVDRNNISKTSSFETYEGKQLLSSTVNIAKKSYGFIMDAQDKDRKNTASSSILKVQQGGGGDDEEPPPFEEPPIQIMPDLCELVECPDIGGPTQGVMDVIATYIDPRDYPKPFSELDRTNSYDNSPRDLETDYCPPVIRRALNDKQAMNIDYDEQMRRQLLRNTINFKKASCFDNFRAKILGPISSIFSQGGGNSAGFLQQITQIAGQLGISIPLIDGQLPIIGDIMGIFNQFLGRGCTGYDSMGGIMNMFKQYAGRDGIYAIYQNPNQGYNGGWRTQITSLIGRPDQKFIDARNLGRYFEEYRYNAMDSYILRYQRCGNNPNCN